jgi:adenine-specific DNA-methyltransferase
MFQFDSADLDFGIYRIMNYKRDAIEKFISKDLVEAIQKELQKGALAEQSQAAKEFQETKKRILETLGEDAIDDEGNLAETYHKAPLGKKYLDLRSKAAGASGSAALEAAIFNHLYTFLSRYYDNGDFMSKRRYSKKEKYAIPYNGEEVYLHWANSDQYYIKTGEYFSNYSFDAKGIKVNFKLQDAQVEKDNIKGDKRLFIPLVKQASFDAKAKQVFIPFEFRPLTEKEGISYGKKNQQDAIITEAIKAIGKHFEKEDAALTALMAECRKTSDGKSVGFLQHHLRHYTRKNTSDFFIHKNLKDFLDKELDFYLKNEVLNLDELEASGETRSEGWFQLMQVIRNIGQKIIQFLAQIEDFQKKLFEKKKFVTETNYCITVGNIPEDFYEAIVTNDAQWKEWKELFHIDEEQKNLFNTNAKSKKDKRIAFLKHHPTLVLDTCHFEGEFTNRLLASFENIDELTDGLLINGENFQTLNLLLRKYRHAIQCIYIDPPYNTGDSEILYKNSYLFSCWLSLMENRFRIATELLTENPTAFIAIDDFEMADLCELIDTHFPFFKREMIVVNHHPQGGKATTLANTHEYMLTLVDRDSDHTLTGRISKEGVEYRPFKRSGTAESNFRYGRPNSFYAVLVNSKTNQVVGIEAPPGLKEKYPAGNTKEGYLRIYPLGKDSEERVWRRSYESCLNLVEKQKLHCSDKQTIYQLIETHERSSALFSNWIGTRYNAGTFGANLLSDIIGKQNPFSYPKSIHTVEDAIFSVSPEENFICLDYFAGSGTTGHAIINLNRENKSQKKFFLVEMGEYFDTVLLPRIKKVTYSPEWKDGKPKRMATSEEAERSPRIIKYQRIESYEDALNNISFTLPKGQKILQFDDYLLNYMLEFETKDSKTFLNVEKLTEPFSYKLVVHEGQETKEKVVDLPETFNYLLGLYVKTRRVYQDKDRRYLVYRGTMNHSDVAVIWRETKGWKKQDFERDKKFVTERKLTEGADEIFVNGDSFIPKAKSLDPVFKHRMFGGS